MTPPPRGALAIVLTQAWLVGAVPGTFAGLLITALLQRSVVNGIGFFAFLFAFVALVIAAVPFALGLLLAMAAPRWVLRWRTPLCLSLPVLAAGGWSAFTAAAAANRWLIGLAFTDAACAAAWVWWRTRPLLPARARDVARVFE